MRDFNAISTFSGAMGLDLGLERVGTLIGDDLGTVKARFVIRACVENDKACQETIKTNMMKGRTNCRKVPIYADITEIHNPNTIIEEAGLDGELDLLVGGPPCQSYSTVGNRGTVQDPRGSLMWEFVRFVRELRPNFFLMENVRGLMSAAIRHRPIKERGPKSPPLEEDEKQGSVVKILLQDFEKEGYHVDIFEVNAVNYGAPQLRERVLFIGNRFNKLIKFPKPTHALIDPPIDRLKLDVKNKGLKPFRTMWDAIGGIKEENAVILDFSPRKKRYLSMVPPGGNWRSMPVEIQKESMGNAWYAKGGRSGWWRRLSFDLPSPCLLTLPNHAGTSLCHPTETRALSVREYARIQEFPDEWVFVGKPQEQYTQIGNAVPVRLGEVAGKILGDALLSLAGKEKSIGPGEYVKSSRRYYIKSHIRTRKWYHNGNAVIRNNNQIERNKLKQVI